MCTTSLVLVWKCNKCKKVTIKVANYEAKIISQSYRLECRLCRTAVCLDEIWYSKNCLSMFYLDKKYKPQTTQNNGSNSVLLSIRQKRRHYFFYYGSFCFWITLFQIGVEPNELNSIDKSQTETHIENAKVQEEMEAPTSRN